MVRFPSSSQAGRRAGGLVLLRAPPGKDSCWGEISRTEDERRASGAAQAGGDAGALVQRGASVGRAESPKRVVWLGHGARREELSCVAERSEWGA